MSLLRIDKVLSERGIVTRSEAKKLISLGRVSVNGKIVNACDQKVETDTDEVIVDGRLVNKKKNRYFMLYKPDGVISATEDDNQKTVLDLLPSELTKLNLFPVGRLDKDTTGLLILTNDGEFCHSVTSPKKHIEKVYEFTVEGNLSNEDAIELEKGITLRDGTICLPAKLKIDDANQSHGFITVYEGKYHQVKRMLASRGTPVRTLKRVSVGGLTLDDSLKPGEYKEINDYEIGLIIN